MFDKSNGKKQRAYVETTTNHTNFYDLLIRLRKRFSKYKLPIFAYRIIKCNTKWRLPLKKIKVILTNCITTT